MTHTWGKAIPFFAPGLDFSSTTNGAPLPLLRALTRVVLLSRFSWWDHPCVLTVRGGRPLGGTNHRFIWGVVSSCSSFSQSHEHFQYLVFPSCCELRSRAIRWSQPLWQPTNQFFCCCSCKNGCSTAVWMRTGGQ